MPRLLALAALLVVAPLALAGPKVGVVVGPDSPKLERFAADELAAQFKQLFDAEVTVADKAPAGVDHLVLVGSPKTNPAVAAAVGDKWPKLSEQGHVLRSVVFGDREALVVGGGSPVATLWAAYELGHHFGVRSFLHGDLYPEKAPELKLDGIDVALEPTIKSREWTLLDPDPIGFGAWGADDYKKLLRQLAKLKFNRVLLAVNPAEPPLPFGRRLVVAGDTPGRKAFKGTKEFENPALAGRATDADRRAAVAALAEQLGEAAGESGMGLDRSKFTAAPGEVPAHTLLPRSLHPIRDGGAVDGFGLERVVPSDAEVVAYHLSRRAFDPGAAGKSAASQLFTPVIGNAATERAALGFALIEEANALVAKNDPKAADVSPDSLAKQLAIGDAPPEWWKEAGKKYAGAMNEMYRAIRATFNDPARPMLLYHAKRCEFAMHYFAALESARLAGVAKSKGDKDAVVTNLEKALESTYNALNAFGDVARDPSDRGVIAVLAEDAYRPLKAALKAADKK